QRLLFRSGHRYALISCVLIKTYSRLVRDSDLLIENVFEDFVGAALQQRLRYLATQLFRVLTLSVFAQNFTSIRTAYHRLKMQPALALFRKRSNRHLASATERSQQRPFALNRRARVGVIQK